MVECQSTCNQMQWVSCVQFVGWRRERSAAGGERQPIKRESLWIMVFKTATRHLVSQGFKKLLLVFGSWVYCGMCRLAMARDQGNGPPRSFIAGEGWRMKK